MGNLLCANNKNPGLVRGFLFVPLTLQRQIEAVERAIKEPSCNGSEVRPERGRTTGHELLNAIVIRRTRLIQRDGTRL